MAAVTGTCAAVREAVSACRDGEPAALAAGDVARHLAACRDCRTFEDGLEEVGRRTRVTAAAEVPDLSDTIVAAVAERTPARDRDRDRVRGLRLVVALAGVAQLLVAVPLLAGVAGAGGHLGRDLGAFELALGVGFLVAAFQPHRAPGVLPVAAVVVVTVVLGGAVDLVAGRATLLMELPHLSEIVGLAALWALYRRSPQRPVTLRAAEVV
jgi:predicted anti-sigma-YlaC factor YlaD